MNILKSLSIILFLSCSVLTDPDIIIIDDKNIPIENVTVHPYSKSVNYLPIESNENGEVWTSEGVQKIHWLSIEKDGYISQDLIPYNQKKPIYIKLIRDKK